MRVPPKTIKFKLLEALPLFFFPVGPLEVLGSTSSPERAFLESAVLVQGLFFEDLVKYTAGFMGGLVSMSTEICKLDVRMEQVMTYEECTITL